MGEATLLRCVPFRTIKLLFGLKLPESRSWP